MADKKALMAVLAGGLLLTDAGGQAVARRTEADVLSNKQLSIPTQRQQAVLEIGAIMSERRSLGRRRARQLGMAARTVRKDGTVTEVVDIDDRSNQPVFLTTHNANAAITTGALAMRATGGLTGDGVVAGVWDGGAALAGHQELQGGRVVVRDGGAVSDHATHVAGTMVASGFQAVAAGMAVSGRVDSYDWSNDRAEMVSRAASFANETGKIPISNHSYGFVRGWNWNGSRYVWSGFSGNSAGSTETYFGLYGSIAGAIDAIAHNSPYYLMFWSAGNDRNNNPTTGSSVVVGGTVVVYSPSQHPPGDGVYRGGYDTLGDYGVAKNVMTIGAVSDAVTGGVRDPSRATVSSFTSWGPTDDGRIKPDLVANGVTVYSPVGSGTTAYASYSGTSMASPNAAGTAMLLVEHYGNLFPGEAMLSSTLKGLLIHTADDRGRPGPDYQYGWGLIDGEEAMEVIDQHQADPSKQRIAENVLSTAVPTRVHEFVWDGYSAIKVTISWTDPEGNSILLSDSRVRNLVNDLNIRMIGPDDEEFFPFILPFVGTWTQASMTANATAGVNTTDNVEQILVSNPPAAGVYRVFVTHGGSLSGGEQNYSLLVSGSGSFNTAPGISAIGDVTALEDGGDVVIQFSVDDEQSEADEIEVTVLSENGALTGEGVLAGVGGDWSATFSPVENGYGESVITVTASDGELLSSTVFNLSILAINDPPTLTVPGGLTLTGGAPSGPLLVSVADVDNGSEEIILSATSDNQDLLPNESIHLEGAGQNRYLSFIAPEGRHGAATVTVTASDGVLVSQASFGVDIIANPHPTLAGWIEGWGISEGTGAADDPDGDGVPNALEYFHGSDPTAHETSPVITQEIWGDFVVFNYRRSKALNGVSGTVTWSAELDPGAGWTADGVVDQSISVDPDYDWRRAIVPWPAGQGKVFTRIELTILP